MLLTAPAVVAIVLGVRASIDGGRLLFWDGPIATPWSTCDRRTWTGSPSGCPDWGRPRWSSPRASPASPSPHDAVAPSPFTIFVVVAARPPFEWLVKEVVARPRPTGARLVAGTGFAYLGGHVLAAGATWGFVLAIAGL